MLVLLILFSTCIQVYLFEEININNCINGANITTTKCEYNINFNNIGNKTLHCIINFTSSNPTVIFKNNLLKVKFEDLNKCPFIDLNIISVVNGTTKSNKVSSTCGGQIDKLEKNFSNFSLFIIKFDPKGLNDQDSQFNASLVIVGDCEKTWIIWIICITSSIIIVVVIGSVVIISYNHQTRKYKAAVIQTGIEKSACCWCCRKQIYGAGLVKNNKKKSKSGNNKKKQNTDKLDDEKQRDCLV